MAGIRHKDKVCWVFTDSSSAAIDGVLALATAIGVPFEVKQVNTRPAWRRVQIRAWPYLAAMDGPIANTSLTGQIVPPWPELIITDDHRSVPQALAIKYRTNGSTLVIGTQHPRIHLDQLDLLVVPRHQMLAAPNVEPILGFPHGVSPEIMSNEATLLATKLAHLPRPLVAVWIGGDSKEFKLPKVRLEELCAELAALTRKHRAGLVIATSHHAHKERTKLVADRLADVPAYVWDGSGRNPFVGFLGLADHIIITVDSEIEISEATITGKPIHLVPLTGGYAASRRFRKDLEEYGAIRIYNGDLATWSYQPLREAERVGLLIREMIERHQFANCQEN